LTDSSWRGDRTRDNTAPVNDHLPLVSVCVPTFNSADFVAETVESILAQDYPALEVIIADHGSSDDTASVLRRFAVDPRVQLIFGPPGGGAAANWNRATDRAAGEFIKLVCADDPLRPTCLSRQVAVLVRNPGVVLVASKRDIIDARGGMVLPRRGLSGLHGRTAAGGAMRAFVRSGTNIFGEPSSVLMRTDAFRASGPWRDALPYLIDVDMYARVLRHGDMYALPESLASFRVSGRSWSLSLAHFQAQQTRAMFRILEAEYPGCWTRHDRLIGGVRAELGAWARRVIYLTLHGRRRLE
jgi:glycosyltransferase involved in cell wall biosynthesis